jgi:hypothetical protein
MGRITSTTVALVLFCEACSSSYQPARSPRISVIQEGGSPTLVRDGQTFSVGLFGGGLEDAVRGNPAAEEHASSYKTLSIAGWSVYVAGLGSSIAGIFLLADNRAGGSNNDANDAAGAALALGGVAALVTSIVLLSTAQPHLWDAVNIYNDGVDASPAYPMQPPGLVRPAPAAPPPGSPSPPSAAPPPPPPVQTPPPAPGAPSPQ